MRKNNKKQIVLNRIEKKLNFCDKLLLWVLKNYTIKIYKMGFDDAFNWK